MRTRRTISIVVAVGMFVASAIAVAIAAGPISAASAEERESRGDIRISTNDQFDADRGVRSGSGTAADPYVISGWDVGNLVINDTSAWFTITNVNVRGQMILNWTGEGAHVYGNDVRDLRVNQNVPRTGAPTTGVIENNSFGVVGQLRHWDGVFQLNTVGTPPADGDLLEQVTQSARAVNFDGFNGAQFTNNTIYGYMDARLHGHHHSSAFGESGSHDHAQPEEGTDHTQRFHEVSITNNKIYADSQYALAYLDTNHAANDRTANSEANPALNDPHVHNTRVHMSNNELIGSGLAVRVFNADDERHTGTAPGMVEMMDNRIHLIDSDPLSTNFSRNGISADTARDLMLHIVGNVVTFERTAADPLGLRASLDRGAGIFLRNLDLANAHLCHNEVQDRYYGVRAATFSESTQWLIHALTTQGVTEEVFWDGSVVNEPDRSATADSACGH